jgi:hypothetical protein
MHFANLLVFSRMGRKTTLPPVRTASPFAAAK